MPLILRVREGPPTLLFPGCRHTRNRTASSYPELHRRTAQSGDCSYSSNLRRDRSFVQSAVAPNKVVVGISGIDPDHVIIDVFVLLAEHAESLAAVIGHANENVHHVNAIDVLGIGEDLRVIHRGLVVRIATLPGCPAITRTKDTALPFLSLDGCVHNVVIDRRDGNADASHIDGGQT